MNPDVLLTVAGTDSGGAAGVAADLATFAGLGAHGCCVVTAVTAQDTTGVHAVHPVPLEVVSRQLDAVLGDLPVAAVKTGMLGDAEVVRLVARRLGGGPDMGARPLVVDPVLVATSGAVLGDAAVVRAYVEDLLPVAGVVTPNADEARSLLGAAPDACPRDLAAALARLGPHVVLTGGPAPGAAPSTCTDWVACPGEDPVALTHPAVATGNDHGTGCTFSAALAVHLGRGMTLLPAARRAAAYTAHQLRISRGWTLGRGRGPVAHVGAHLATHPGSHPQETR
ncbi:bifunctional hydroxymethylpyrimidine kinase/phosphomethylpyrimidine kinase [Nocardioides pacificus]